MTREELENQFADLGFKHDVFSEYNNDVFENMEYVLGDKRLNLEAFVDYYNLRLIWHYCDGKKVSKNYYISKEVADYNSAKALIEDFVAYCMVEYGIK